MARGPHAVRLSFKCGPRVHTAHGMAYHTRLTIRPPFEHFSILNGENMSKYNYTAQTTACGCDDLVFLLFT